MNEETGNAPPRPEAPGSPWGELEIADAAIRPVPVGPLELEISAVENELRLAVRRRPGSRSVARAEVEVDPDGVVIEESRSAPRWSRWALSAPPRRIVVAPVLPNRPLLLAPEEDFTLLPGAEVRIYVRVPACVGVRLPKGREAGPRLIQEFPTVDLPSTWFGDYFDGELCYWIPTRAGRSPPAALRGAHVVCCPIQIRNRSEEPLQVEKLVLRVRYLSLFEDQAGALWSDETRITYRGGGEFSRLRWSGKPPPEAPQARKLEPPREPAASGVAAWTFAHLGLAKIAGLGGRQ
jgi:hypothetical protein